MVNTLCLVQLLSSLGIRTLIRILQSRGTKVYLVSGGFRQLIEPFAEHLGIPREDVYANRLIFADDGEQ